MSAWGRNSGPVTCLQDEHQGNSSCQGADNAALRRVLGEIFALAIPKTLLTQEEMV